MISPEVVQELLAVRQVLHYLPESQSTEKGWSPHEQQLFWVALAKYPQGPWTSIADFIGTKSTRQAMTHAQKLRQKLKHWNSRLRSNPAVSSLMDSVTVSSDGNVAVSSDVATVSTEPTELESKDREQHSGPSNQTQHGEVDAIPHEFVDRLANSLMGEEDQDDDEVTDEQLKELDDGK